MLRRLLGGFELAGWRLGIDADVPHRIMYKRFARA